VFHVGLDDTDSPDGMCTTYVGAVVVDRLKGIGVRLTDFPFLVRLNPNWPLKTRGNCAVAVRFRATEAQFSKVREMVLATVEELAELDHRDTTPGVAFYRGAEIPRELREFSKRVIQDIVTIRDAERVAKKVGAETHKFKLGRGIIGALAAIGETLERDSTYELVAYRTPEHRGTKRCIDEMSVAEMDSATFPETFDNVDPFTGEIRITPHTPCPVLYGIRSENPAAAERAHLMVRSLEPIERWIVYKTNQGTDDHLKEAKISEIKPLRSYVVEGVVVRRPMIIRGGHVIFAVQDATGTVDCAAYEPTRGFRSVAAKLREGDVIRVCGGVKRKRGRPLTMNLEKIQVVHPIAMLRKVNPTCHLCGKRMKSAGAGKGYRCRKCGTKAPESSVTMVEVKRDIDAGRFEVPPRARRHLARPLIRVKPLSRGH